MGRNGTPGRRELSDNSQCVKFPYNLCLGSARDGRDNRAILDSGIQAVVDLAREEPPTVLVRELAYCRLPLADRRQQPALAVARRRIMASRRLPTK